MPIGRHETRITSRLTRAGKMRHSGSILRLVLAFGGGWIPWVQAQEKPLDDLLNLSLKDLANLQVVTALKGPATASSVPATLRVITAEEIRERGYTTLEEALGDLPGFQFRNIQGFNSYVFMRGVPQQNNKILLLVDGIQINELNSGGFYGGGQFNLTNVARIEVVYGPASALYGTNAVSGIVNLLTRDPRDTTGGRATLSGGSFRTGQADVRYGQYDPDSTFGFTLSALVRHTGKADLRGAKGDFNWSGAMENVERDRAVDGQVCYGGFRGGWVIQDKDASSSTVQPYLPDAGGPVYRDHGTNWHIRFVNTWLNYAWKGTEAWSFQSTLYVRDAAVQDDSVYLIEAATAASPGRQMRYQRPGRLWGNETQVAWTPWERWRLSAGLVLERERLAQAFSISRSASEDQPAPVPGAPPMLTNHLTSAYLQAQIPVLATTDLFLGLRHDDSSSARPVTTPRLGLVFNRDPLTVKLLYGEAFRAPKPWDYTDGVGNPNLQPEKMRSLECTGGWAFSDRLRIELSLYQNHLDNLLARTGPEGAQQWVNTGLLNTRGTELALVWQTDSLKAYANYTYTASHNENGVQVPEIARHGGNAGLHWALSPAWRLHLRGQVLGARTNPKVIPTTGNDRIDAAMVFHGALSWRPVRGFDLQFVATNLADEVYYHPSNLPPSRYRQAQLSARLQLGWTF